MKIIRWWGAITFVILILLLAIVWYLVAPKIIKSTIETLGSETLGAKIEIRQVQLALFPLSVEINQLTAANPDQPMSNLFEVAKFKFKLDASELVWKKVLIEELNLTGIKMGTARVSSGELEGGRKTTQAITQVVEMNVPDINAENIKELIDKADLISVKRIKDLTQNQNKIKQQWQQALDKKAFNSRIDKIKNDYKNLSARLKKSKLYLIKDRKKWKKLKEQIKNERKQIASLSGKLKADKKQLSQQLKLAKLGPKDDLKAIMSQFGLSQGVEGMVNQYLGPQYTPWVMQAVDYVKQMDFDKPREPKESTKKLEKGKAFTFADQHQAPEFLIQKINISGSDQGIDINGDGFNLGYLPWLTGKPAKLDFQLSGKRKAYLKVNSQWKNESKMTTNIHAKITTWPIETMQFLQTKEGAWTINSGDFIANINGEISLESINLNAAFSIKKPNLSVPKGLSDWQIALAESINQQAKINFKLTATGKLTKPKIKLTSDIEKLFKQAIGNKIKQKAQKLKGKVKQAIADKVGGFSKLEKFNNNFNQWKSQIKNKDDLLKELLGKIKI